MTRRFASLMFALSLALGAATATFAQGNCQCGSACKCEKCACDKGCNCAGDCKCSGKCGDSCKRPQGK